jgi:prepilin-type N-terminal cleavage/methylation domain-containing protein
VDTLPTTAIQGEPRRRGCEPRARRRRAGGFSLIEVLVAAAVLSVGLLALASLQISLVRTSADSKAYSVALSLAKDKIEELRSFNGVRGPVSYQSITDGTDVPGNVGGVDYLRAWTVSRYVYNRDPDGNPATSDRKFLAYATDTGDTPNPYNGNTGTGWVDDNEFKRIAVRVTWVDATGSTQTVALEDAVASLSPSDAALISRSGSAVIPRTVEAIIRDPTLTNGVANGVIPLALSSDAGVDGTSTAATNPQPKLLGADFRVAETRYNILTYGALRGDGTAAAESKVDTVVVGCTCSYANADTGVTGYRPAYWNGYRYTPPGPALTTQPAGWTHADNESAQCTACCRDHHDQVNGVDVSNDGPRFDPRRTAHQHYRHDASGNLVNANNSGVYEESCRMVRVDGVYRVTPDAYTDQLNLLETINDSGTTPFLPSTQATSNYQAFALKLLDARVVNNANAATYNNSVSAGTVAALEDPTPASFPSKSINVPASITIDSNQQKWLHARGLYVDYMEPEVVAAITNAKTLCAIDNASGGCAGSLAKQEAAVLPLVPFTSINMTEIADWTPARPTDAGGQDVLAYNNLLKCTVPAADGGPAAGCISTTNGVTTTIDPNRPVRGMVQKINASAGAGNQPAVVARIYASNSTLAALGRTIDPDEGSALSDAQNFLIAGGSGGGSTASYKVAILGAYPLSSGARPALDTSPASTYIYQNSGSQPGFVAPNPITVTPNPVTFGVPVTLRLKAYNYALTTFGISGAITCTGPSGNKILTSTDTNSNKLAGKQATCKNYAVTGVDVNGTPVAGPYPIASIGTPGTPNGSLTEYTTLSLPAVNANDVVNLTIGAESDSLPAATCTYTSGDLNGSGTWKNNGNPTVIAGSCPP